MIKKLVAIGLVLAACTFPRPASAQTRLNIIQPVLRSMLVWPIHVGEMLGYFDREGVSLELISTDANIPYTVFLVSGNADLVLIDSAQALHALNAGYDVASIYSVHNPTPQGIFVSEDSPIFSVTDLKDKTVGLGSDRDRLALDVALAREGISGEDVSTVVVGDSGPILTGVFTNRMADAFAGSLTAIIPLAAYGIRLRDIARANSLGAPTNSFLIQRERMEELREPVCGFLRAWSKAIHIGSQDIEIIAAMSRHPEGVPETWENPAFGYQYLHAVADLEIPRGDTFGKADPNAWQAVLDDMLLVGEIEIRHDVHALLDDSFLSCANDFDRDQVMREAHAWMDDPANAEYVRHFQ
jgi:NitT/TauT family transport system substrate-binding protein